MTALPAARPPRSPAAVLLPALLLVLGPAAVVVSMRHGATPPRTLVELGALGLLALLTPAVLRVLGRGADSLLVGAAWTTVALGTVSVARVRPDLLERQIMWAALGWAAFVAVIALPSAVQLARRYKYTWLTLSIALMLLTFAFGTGPGGSDERLWLAFGPFTFQPSELLRIIFVVFLAGYLTSRREPLTGAAWRLGPLSMPPLEDLLPLAAMVALSLLIVLFQHDIGPALLLFATFLAVLYLALGRFDYVVIGAVLFVVLSFAAYHLSGHVHERISAWLNPWNDPRGLGYQSLSAIGGMASGGVIGTGPGYGFPTLVPAAHTDYPFAVIGEEWGLVGALAVVLLYALMVSRAAMLVMRRARDPFALLLGVGLAVSLGLQALISIGGALRVLPLAGLTTPFLSYGGSSMVMNWAALGLIVATARPRAAVDEAGAT